VPSRTLVDALASALVELHATTGSGSVPPWGSMHAVTFRHPLGITDAARRRFNVGPFPLGGYESTVMATEAATESTAGASYRQIIDLANWDRMVVSNAPGQSGSPSSPHFSDLVRQGYVVLPFSAAAVSAAGSATLTLVPR